MKYLLLTILIIFPHLSHARVENPIIFKGEQSINTTPGAPLSTDANNQVTSGITNVEVSSSSASTCTTSAATLNGMTTSPALAGTYLALFSADFNSANSGIVVTLDFTVAGTPIGVSQRKFMPFAGGTLTAGNQRVYGGLNSILTITAGQAIAVRCSVSSNTVSTASMQLDVVRLQ